MSNEFTEAFAGAWLPALQVFGETITIAGDVYACVVHSLDRTTEVVNGRPGRAAVTGGEIIMAETDWIASGATKGSQVTFNGTQYRVMNEPTVGYTSDTVALRLGPLT